MEWPSKSGRPAEFPEIDQAEFFDLNAAKKKINPAQVSFIDELERHWQGESFGDSGSSKQ